jgi:pimeloyl-ACP methyl ester carboxylesterase
MNDRKLYRRLNPYHDRVEIKYHQQGNYKIRYVDVGDPAKRMVLFIHGAPGSLDAFVGFLKDRKLSQSVRMIALDRPGYGSSCPGNAVTSLKTQAALIQPLLDRNIHEKKTILVGHSYGGPIAATLALLSPDLVGGILLVGAAMDPGHEKIFRISYLIKIPWISAVLPSSIVTTNIEKLTHVEELNKMLTSWKEIRVPVTILHGKNDWIVPVENAYFTNDILVNANKKLVVVEKAGHLIPWIQPELMKNEIFEMLEKH